MSIYSVTGEKILTALDEMKSEGDYSQNIDLKNYPSGTYFCVLNVDGVPNTKKMILLK